MASGTIAPISTSKGPGIDVPPHQFQYPGEANAQVVVYATQKNAAAGLAKSVVEAAAAAIKEKGSFTLVLSGGWSERYCAKQWCIMQWGIGCGRGWLTAPVYPVVCALLGRIHGLSDAAAVVQL